MQFQYVLNAFFSENETFTFVNEGKKIKWLLLFHYLFSFFQRPVLNSEVFEAITTQQKVNSIFWNYELLAAVFRYFTEVFFN